MINLDDLYCEVPPTKLRSKDEKFRPARTSPFWMWVAKKAFYAMLENRFYAFRYKGIENFEARDKDVPTIFFAPHSNWWDGIVAFTICNRICNKEVRLMVEELNRFPILRRGGAFSVNKKSPQASMQSLKYSVNVLKDLNNILYIFPQGIIKPPNFRPIEVQAGLPYIAQKAVKKYGKINLVPIAVNYFFMRDNSPEVWIEMGNVIELTNDKFDRKEYGDYLAKELETLCDKQMYEISQAKFDGYQTLFQRKLKWYRAFEQRLKRIKIKKTDEE